MVALTIAVPASRCQTADSTTVQLRRAVKASQGGDAVAAVQMLSNLVRSTPDVFDPALGSGAYWLGRTLWDLGRRPDALDVWSRGWRTLRSRGLVDLALGDRLLWGVLGERDERRYPLAAAVYLALLDHLDRAAGPQIEAVADRILVPLRLILPDSLRRDTQLLADSSSTAVLRPGAGPRLAAWWRGMDGRPATAHNERLIEHLLRVTEARELYAFDGPRGFDDRGVVYIRFGPAGRKSETRLNPFEIGGSRGLRNQLVTTVPSFPRNEFWVYPHVDREAQFLFVERARGEYRLGTTADLIPRYMRGGRYSRIRLKVMETLLRDLALHHPWTYSTWYEEVATHVSDLEMDDIAAELDRLSGRPGLRIPLRYSPRSPTAYFFNHHRMDERRAVQNRDDEIPEAFFDDFGEISDISVALRWARFLGPDGATRVELYWSAPTREFADAHHRLNRADRRTATDFVVDLHVVEFDSQNRRRERVRVRRRVEGVLRDDGSVLTPQTVVINPLNESGRLSLQWDVEAMAADGDSLRSPRVGMALARLDSLRALSADRRRLEMSDLKPVLVSASGEPGPPYPGGVLVPGIKLGLEFEVYHLTFGADDRTHYTVTYELARTDDIAFRTRARQEAATSMTTASTRYSGTSTTQRETIVLDLTPWSVAGSLTIYVRVRDDTTRQEVVRSLEFTLEPGS